MFRLGASEARMREEAAERVLAALYAFSGISSGTSVICMATAWQYWAWTLDVCIDIDCGCILYGINTFSTFMGGDVKLCHFGVYGLIPAIAIGLALGGYHGYRSCIGRNLDRPVRAREGATVERRNLTAPAAPAEVPASGQPASIAVTLAPKRRRPCKQWIPAAFLTLLLSCLSLAHAVVAADGYYETCKQYRKRLIQVLGSTGREAEVLHDRLSCGAIFDFMDYLHSDANGWRNGREADTGLLLRSSIVSTWLNFIAWTTAFILNVIMARKRLRCCRGRRFR